MRFLSPALEAAQKAPSGIPLLKTVVRNTIRILRHLQWTSVFTAFVADDKHGAAADADHLHRVRVDAGVVKYQQDPGAAETTLATATTHCAIAAINDTRVIVAYTFGSTIFTRESTDQGLTFAAAVPSTTGGANPTAISIAYKNAGGDLAIIFAQSNTVKRVRRTAGTYGSVTSWTQSAASINGITVDYHSDFHIVLTGTETTTLKPTIWRLVLGDGFHHAVDTWATFFPMIQAEADAQITFQAPFLHAPDTHRITFVEIFAGTQAYTQTYWTYTVGSALFGESAWLDPAPIPSSTNQGVAITSRTGTAMLSRPSEVWEASSTAVSLDMTDDLIEATMQEVDGLHQRGRWIFDNSNGQYAGPPAPIILHHDLRIDLGYVVAGVDESSGPPDHVIVGWEYRRDGGRSTFILHTKGTDVWLDYRHRTTIIRTGLNMLQVLGETAARAGLDLVDVGSSSRATTLDITWTTHPHKTHTSVLEALIPLYADVFRSHSDLILIFEPKFDDDTDYNFTTEGHPVYHSRTKQNHRPSFFEGIGEGVIGQAFDFDELDSDKPISDRPRDPNTTTGADALALAAARARKAILEEDLGYLIVAPHCGIELFDVIEYSASLVSASSIKARVTALRLTFRRSRNGAATFEQRIALGGV